jgi:predicted ATP-grasp superfamily ATP-dependent carboligase
MDEGIHKILVIGVDLTALAYAVSRAGYKVFAADYFGDLDLRKVCKGYSSILQQRAGKSTGRIESNFDPRAFLRMGKSLIEKEQIDVILLSSGLEDSFNVLHELNELVEILGNKRLGIPHPTSIVVNSLEDAKTSAKDLGFPVVLKPLEGFAGFAIRKAERNSQLEKMFQIIEQLSTKGVLIQEYIEGTDASISFIASSTGVRILTLNEQLIGLRELYQHEQFGYCGNIVPLEVEEPTRKVCEHIVEKISTRFDLRGSNGIDVVISKSGTPKVIEVNPRFQGTQECVERVLGVNLVKMHIDACVHGSLPIYSEIFSKSATRLILNAPRRVATPDLTFFEGVRDIPLPKTIIEEGEPLCSVIADGEEREISLKNAKEKADTIYRMLL